VIKNAATLRHSFEGILGWLNLFSLIAGAVFPLLFGIFFIESLSFLSFLILSTNLLHSRCWTGLAAAQY